MYASFFGLRELPFNNTLDPRYFYSTPDHEEALASLIYAISESRGFVMLTGEVGAGKTLVTRLMLRHFNERIVFAGINHTRISSTDLLRCICDEFHIESVPHDTGADLLRRLQDFLVSRFTEGKPVVLMLDEAQALSRDAFEQVRMIGNVEADDAKLLQIVIVGQPELRQRFEADDMRQLRQRMFRSFHLRGLSREQTEGYIRHRLSVGGAQYPERIFDHDAIDIIHQYAQGLPRLINTVCDNAMLSAYAADQLAIDGPFVRRVIEQMTSVGQGGPQFASPIVTAADERPRRRASDRAARETAPNVAPAPAPAPRVDVEMPITFNDTRALQARQALEDSIERSCVIETRLKSELIETTDALQALVTRAAGLHERLRAAVAEAEQRIDQTTQRAARIQSTVDEVINRLDAAGRRGAPLLGQLHAQVDQAQGVMDEFRSAGTYARGILAETQRACSAADEAAQRLALQTTRSTRLTVTLRQAFDRLQRQSALLEERTRRPDADAESKGTASACGSLLAKTRALTEVLGEDRGTIADVRSTLLAARTGSLAAPRTRLAEHVGSLSELIERTRNLSRASA